ncbi:hypothetical protein LOTGIDRAFT_229439 [Lottia gigantea]|uniref:Vacuolar protein sorting-associated protein 54 n=1 Tax=Lottia gigantea TaxID=225164 RepID=V3ZSC1_LOTGI|nr:hypothetical protein LOTGIDRAFT_229439 [Lottia gigantea]ESO85430.1 hypothetical protein LOTGIDRAFT_229439 [Lottia gigantea]
MSTKLDSLKLPVPWKKCLYCKDIQTSVFKSPREFCQHLRDFHCTKEGGSYVCRYGMNNVCQSLPVDGVSDKDYEDHVAKDHVYSGTGGARNKVVARISPCVDSASSVNTEPCIVQDQFKWTIYNASVNLPAVLNNPRLAKRETDFFTKTWGSDFDHAEIYPSPYIPEITPDDFDHYLQKTSVRHRKHMRNLKRLAQEEEKDTYPSHNIKELEKNREELNQVPKLFMLPNFSLENLDTFSAVFPWLIDSNSDNNTTRQSSKLLQEKLSHYLDIVEVQIAKQISVKSDAFFHAMTSHDELQEQLLHTCQAIKKLRDKTHTVDENLAKGQLKLIKLCRSRANYIHLYNKLKSMSAIHQTQQIIQTLLGTNEFVGALDLISTTQDILNQHLAGIHSFRHLGSQLSELEKLIDKMLQADFCKYISEELNRPVTDLQRLAEEEKLVSIVFGMLKQNNFSFIDTFKDETFTSIKAIVKQTVVEHVCVLDDGDSDGIVRGLGDQMRLLDYPQWTDLLKDLFSNLLVILERAKAFSGVVSDVIGISAGRTKSPSPTISPIHKPNLQEPTHINVPVDSDVDMNLLSDSDYMKSIGNLNDMLCSVSSDSDVDMNLLSDSDYMKSIGNLNDMLCFVCDYAHDRCVRVFSARAKDGFLEKLSLSEFVALSRLVEDFVTDCENICGRKSISLRAILQTQSNRFICKFHEERKSKLSLILDNERWKQADVPVEFQDLVDHISQSGCLTIPERRNDSDRKPQEYLLVDSEKFAVVGTVLMLVKMIVEYCQCLDDIPNTAPDLLTRLIELIKNFNSRTCQLVIGAGALTMVGLKTITTKNLALASRCLQLIVHYIPKVKNHFQEKLPQKNQNMLKYFEQVVNDYENHIEEINNKFVSIMEKELENRLFKYEVKAPMPSNCFRTICKNNTKLHEALIDILPVSQVKLIFKRINEVFKRILEQQLYKLGVSNDGGPQHGLVMSDLVFYSGSFKTLKGLEYIVVDTNDIWRKR